MNAERPGFYKLNDRVRPGLQIALLLVLFVTLSVVAGIYLPTGIDWHYTYRPAAILVLAGQSPFTVPIHPFFAAPWVVIPLIPFALMPENIGRGFLFVLGLCVFAYTAWKLGARPMAMAAFLLSPPVWHCLLNSNVEWLPLLGYVLPPQLGLFLIVIKPQIGLGAGIYWLIESWRKGGIKQVVRVFAPVSLVLLLSFAMYGLWPLRFNSILGLAQDFNQSLWPLSIPVGLALLVYAIRKRTIYPAMAASPCLSPYVLLHAWVGALAAVIRDTPLTVAAVIGLWIVMGMRAFGGG